MVKRRQELTFRHNQNLGRHGWLRLTPAYSVKVVEQILEHGPSAAHVLDPFSGTGTTGLVCAERGLSCTLIDINPFLVWFAEVKTANYSSDTLREASHCAEDMAASIAQKPPTNSLWVPPISNIARWWPAERLNVLACIHHELKTRYPSLTPAKNLLLVAFCRLIIEMSNAAYNHQSVSFKKDRQLRLFEDDAGQYIVARFVELAQEVVRSAQTPLAGQVRVLHADSRHVPHAKGESYDLVITSPPYPNRMSYIRELRPYMYWLGYLQVARDAGELDWQAIGGTWGIATSRLQTWQPNGMPIAYPRFLTIIEAIAEQSSVLANYVHKYFVDAATHLKSLYQVLAPNAPIFYIVGNSKFYDTLVPTQEIYAALMQQAGFADVAIEVIRKRNSKKELFEYIVSARKPH